jgi:DNA-binding CsgD family transcriptional regulator
MRWRSWNACGRGSRSASSVPSSPISSTGPKVWPLPGPPIPTERCTTSGGSAIPLSSAWPRWTAWRRQAAPAGTPATSGPGQVNSNNSPEDTGAAWAAAIAAHGRALIAADGDTDDPEPHFLQAIAEHSRASRPVAQARTQLAYGEFLRRSRRRVDARAQLRAALDAFAEVGALPWADRAGQELRASGETARQRDPSTSVQLTPHEQQVASLVSRGSSNADVAAQLFLSRRTVEYHLRNAYQKLGVRSRGDLVRLALG